jgi:hypothetical protein
MNPLPTGRRALRLRLQSITAELQAIEQEVRSAEVDPRVLREFRQATDHVRQTCWALQQWHDLEAQRRDAYSVLSLLTQERVRMTTQLARDLARDLDTAELTVETPGISGLQEALQELYQRLSRIGRSSGP